MAKTYIEQLGEWVKKRTSTRRDKNLVAFLAVSENVRVAIKAGYAVKTIWINMVESKQIEFSYDTFLKYTHRFIRQPSDYSVSANKSVTKKSTIKSIENCNSVTKSIKPAAQAGFVYNPTPNKEELL